MKDNITKEVKPGSLALLEVKGLKSVANLHGNVRLRALTQKYEHIFPCGTRISMRNVEDPDLATFQITPKSGGFSITVTMYAIYAQTKVALIYTIAPDKIKDGQVDKKDKEDDDVIAHLIHRESIGNIETFRLTLSDKDSNTKFMEILLQKL